MHLRNKVLDLDNLRCEPVLNHWWGTKQRKIGLHKPQRSRLRTKNRDELGIATYGEMSEGLKHLL